MADAGSSSRVAKVDAGNGVAKKDVAGRVVEPLVPVSASSAGIAMLAQAKLSVGRVDDPAELEADEMAQKFSQWNGAGGSVEVSEGSSGGDAMRSADTGTLETGGFEVGADVQSEISSRSGRGVPLADDQRSKFEKFFGKDLSAVRVHADSDASELSGSLGAEAFTVGNDVYFGSGHYQSGASDKLLAHELTHVVQQNSTINRGPLDWIKKKLGMGKKKAPAPPNEWDASQYQVAGPTNRGAIPRQQRPLPAIPRQQRPLPAIPGARENEYAEINSENDYEEPVVRPQENKTPPPVPPRTSKNVDRSQTHEDWAPGMYTPPPPVPPRSFGKTDEAGYEIPFSPEPIYGQVKKGDRKAQWSGDDPTSSSAIMSQGGQDFSIPYEGLHHKGDDLTSSSAIMSQGGQDFNVPYEGLHYKGDDLTSSSAIMSQDGQDFDIPYEGLHYKGDDLTSSSAIMSQDGQDFDIPYDKSNWTHGTDKKEKEHAEKKKEKKNLKAEKSFIKTQGTLLKHLPDVPQDERLILAKISPGSVTTRYGKPGQGLTKTEYELFGKHSYSPLFKKAMGIENDLYQLQQIALVGEKTKVWNSLTLTERMVACFYAFEVKAKGNHDCDESWSHGPAFLEGASMNEQNPEAKKSAIEKRTKKAWAETLKEPTPEDLSQLKNKKDQKKIPLQQDILKKIMKILKDETYVDGEKYEGEVETLLSHGGRVNMIIPKLAGKNENKDKFMIKMGLYNEKGKKNKKAGVEMRLASSHDIVKNPDGTFRETKAPKKGALNMTGASKKMGMNIAAGGAGKKDINGDVIRPDGSHGHLYMHWLPPSMESDGVFQVGLETTAFSAFGGIKGTTGRSHGPSDNEDTATPVSSMDGAKNDRALMGLGGSVGSVYKRLPDDWAETLLKATDETKEKLGETAKQS